MNPLMQSIPRIHSPTPTQGDAPSHSPPDTRYVPGNSLVRFLGYFSIGLGLAEILAPDTLSRATGVRQKALLQAYGVREMVCGVGILACSRPTAWLWARVAGDLLDLATVGANFADADHEDRGRLMMTAGALAGATALDLAGAAQLSTADMLTDD